MTEKLKMSILITGGAGYIGSHTVKELQEKGRDVVIYDNLSRGHKNAVKDAPLIVCDLLNTDILSKTFKEYNVKSVIHFAAESQTGCGLLNVCLRRSQVQLIVACIFYRNHPFLA